MSIRISDPRPPYCSACHNAPVDSRYIDFDAVHDGGSFVGVEGQYLSGSEDLHVCESCIREACEALGFKPELQRRQFVEIQKQDIRIEALRDQNLKLKAALAVQVPDDDVPVRRGPGRPRKVVPA
jgi:hypothetical protein